MRVAIINLTGGGMSGGYQKYLRHILPRMSTHADIEALLCASPAQLNISEWFQNITKVEFVKCKPYRIFQFTYDSNLKKNLDRFSPDVIFFTLERYLNYNKIPIVNIVQNMEPFVNNVKDNSLYERIRLLILSKIARRSLIKSVRVIAVSRFVRDFLVNELKIPKDKIGLVYHGKQLEERRTEKPIYIPKEWDGKFLFTAGSIRPSRGLEDILQALKIISNHSNIKGLVIAGEATWNMKTYQEKLKNWIQKNNLSSKVCWAGYLKDNEMSWCYQNCRVFVMTSRVESFGLIALEAMLNGCISISAKSTCLPEIFGDVVIYYPPKDVKSLAEAIQTVFTLDEERRKEMSEKAKKRADQFSWDVCAERTVAELKKAIETYKERNS